MSEHGGNTSRPGEPQRSQQAAHRPVSKLPEGDLGFFLLDVVAQLDVSRFYAPYAQETRGGPPCAPALLGCLVLSASCGGVCASRQLALAGERHWALLAIVGAERPDLRPLRALRQLPLAACNAVCVPVGRCAGAAGLVQGGNVSTAGTTIQGHASRHTALRSGDMQQAVDRLREAREALVTQASGQDEAAEAA